MVYPASLLVDILGGDEAAEWKSGTGYRKPVDVRCTDLEIWNKSDSMKEDGGLCEQLCYYTIHVSTQSTSSKGAKG
jgi:hypothetical protein